MLVASILGSAWMFLFPLRRTAGSDTPRKRLDDPRLALASSPTPRTLRQTPRLPASGMPSIHRPPGVVSFRAPHPVLHCAVAAHHGTPSTHQHQTTVPRPALPAGQTSRAWDLRQERRAASKDRHSQKELLVRRMVQQAGHDDSEPRPILGAICQSFGPKSAAYGVLFAARLCSNERTTLEGATLSDSVNYGALKVAKDHRPQASG